MKRGREDNNAGGGGAEAEPVGPSFATPQAGLQHYSNTLKQLSEEFTKAGLKTDVERSNRFRAALDDCARMLLRCIIVATPSDSGARASRFRIVEVEIYCNDHGLHPDAFTHGNELQERVALWYFHKNGGTYKSGTFKGLDVTFGFAGMAGGMLIRSIERIDDSADSAAAPAAKARRKEDGGAPSTSKAATATKGELIEGPCCVVDQLLVATGATAIDKLVSRRTATSDSAMHVDDASLTLLFDPAASTPSSVGPFYTAPRVGLVPRTAEAMDFVGRFYRHFTRPLKKLRAGIVAAVVAQGRAKPPSSCPSIAGTPASSITSITTVVAKGKAASDAKSVFGGDVRKPDVIAFIVGFCAAKNAL